jgi:hypothetical protein
VKQEADEANECCLSLRRKRWRASPAPLPLSSARSPLPLADNRLLAHRLLTVASLWVASRDAKNIIETHITSLKLTSLKNSAGRWFRDGRS